MTPEAGELAREIAERAKSRLEYAADEMRPGLKLYFHPLSVAERDRFNLAKGDEGSQALDMLIRKAEYENGEKVFSKADRELLRKTLPFTVLDRIFIAVGEYVPAALDPND